MNLFYEECPKEIMIDGHTVPIVTDFREYIRLMDMLKDDELNFQEKIACLSQYFLETPSNFASAMNALTDFVTMKSRVESIEDENADVEEVESRKEVYSFEYDYPFIFSAFLSEYGINIRTIPYLHWWEFKMLFDGLSENTEIKQRIRYRSIDLGTIKDKKERERIQKIQNAIRLPEDRVSDFDIGDAFGW